MDLCDQLTRECILSGDFQLIEKLCSPHTKLHVSILNSIDSHR